MSESTLPTPETIDQPNIDGLKIVGKIDPKVLTDLPGEADPNALLAIIASDNSDGDIEASITRTSYGENSIDPFSAAKLNSIIGGHASGKAHRDVGFKRIRIVCDSDGTIFFPSSPEGEPIFDQPYQAEPGVILEFDSSVWHTAPYEATGQGTRTALDARFN